MLTEWVADEIAEEEAIAEERLTAPHEMDALLRDTPIFRLPNLRQPILLPPDATVRDAAARMHREGLGCVLVSDGEHLLGVFTERDVLGRVVAEGRDGATTRVGDVMTPDPDCLTPDEGIAWALNRMVVGGFRHVPLLDPKNRPVGVVSMRHIVEYLVDAFPGPVLNIAPNPSQAMPREREGA